jgi:ribosomal protein L20A (L18A)
MRACDLVCYGERVATFTYPQPEIRAADEAFVARVVEVLVTALEQASAEKRQAKAEKWRRGVEESVRGELITLDHDKVTELLPRKLTGSEIQSLKAACWNEISRCQPVCEMVRVIEKFVEFCELLARPENHIKVPSKQRVVNTRSVADMTNEMAGELANLPRYTAYAKVLAETGGEQIVLRTKIRTLKLKELPEGEVAEVARQARRVAIEQNSLRYLKSRIAIEEEIRERQEKWRQRTREVPPPVQRQVEKGKAEPAVAVVKEADVPPPPTQSPAGGESDEPPPIHG